VAELAELLVVGPDGQEDYYIVPLNEGFNQLK
jgi:hypothetical protein